MQPAITHGDPIAPVVFGVALLLTAALAGRFAARKLGQPTVLGELLMGVLLGNVLYHAGYDLMVILREGPKCAEMVWLALSGHGWGEAAVKVLGGEAGRAFIEVVSSPGGSQYLQVSQAVDTFSRYGVIFLLFHVGLDTCVAELRQVGMNSLRVAVIGVLAPFALGLIVGWILTPGASHTQHLFLAAVFLLSTESSMLKKWNDSRKSYSS